MSDFVTSIAGGIYSFIVAQAFLLIIRRHLILNIPYQRDSHLSSVVAAQHIADEASLNLHLHLYPAVSI